MADKRNIAVFIASPNDLAVERRAFRDTIDELNKGFGDGAGVEFEALGWEDTLATTGRRAQSVINREIDRCDVFVLVMHRRWGQEAPDAKPYSSYTEEEFHRALERWKRDEGPEIFVFFKHIDPASMADPGPQLAKVLKFRKELERSRQVLYRSFDSDEKFAAEIDRHLRAYERGELSDPGEKPEGVILPIESIEQVEKAKEKARQEAERAEEAERKFEAERRRADAADVRVEELTQRINELAAESADARAEELALRIAEQAAKAALEGRVEEARQSFASVIEGTSNIRILFLAFDFYFRIGDFDVAEYLLERCLAISGSDADSTDTANIYGRFGAIYFRQGDLDRAEEMFRKSLDLSQRNGCEEDTANACAHLGLIFEIRGELKLAEKWHEKSLKIELRLGREIGVATDYGNLGMVLRKQGDTNGAEKMILKSLEILQRLGNQEGMAVQYGNLGIIYQFSEQLDHAEEMYDKALEIHKRLGDQEGMASQLGNLGLIYSERDELDHAEEVMKESLRMHEWLGHLEGVANQYGNLGGIAYKRGDGAKAREYWTKALDLFTKIGMKPEVGQVQRLLDKLDDDEEPTGA